MNLIDSMNCRRARYTATLNDPLDDSSKDNGNAFSRQGIRQVDMVTIVVHGPLPPIPIIVLPTEVANDLVALGLAQPSRNPFGEFSTGDWWMGLLSLFNETSATITLIQGAASLPRVAKRLHEWTEGRSNETESANEPDHRSRLSYRSTKGSGFLILDEKPTLDELTQWLVATYTILKGDAQERQ
jgi:hypothetical protein